MNGIDLVLNQVVVLSLFFSEISQIMFEISDGVVNDTSVGIDSGGHAFPCKANRVQFE